MREFGDTTFKEPNLRDYPSCTSLPCNNTARGQQPDGHSKHARTHSIAPHRSLRRVLKGRAQFARACAVLPKRT